MNKKMYAAVLAVTVAWPVYVRSAEPVATMDEVVVTATKTTSMMVIAIISSITANPLLPAGANFNWSIVSALHPQWLWSWSSRSTL